MTAPSGYVTDGQLQAVAHTYTTALAAGRYPVVAVARQFGWSPAFASMRVSQARRRGFLPSTTPGRPKGVA